MKIPGKIFNLASVAAMLSVGIGLVGGPAVPAEPEAANLSSAGATTVLTSDNAELVVLESQGPQPSADQLDTMATHVRCTLTVQNIHASTHFTGTINGVAKIQCTANAAQLRLIYSLIRVSPNGTEWAATPKSKPATSWLQTNRGVSCSEGPGQFRGWAKGFITVPAGYELVGPASHSQYGNITSVACGGVNSAPVDSTSTEGTTVTVTFIRNDLVP